MIARKCSPLRKVVAGLGMCGVLAWLVHGSDPWHDNHRQCTPGIGL